MSAGKKVNIGIVGLGYWGPNLVRNFSEVDGCYVAMACDSDETRLKPIKRRYPYIQVTTSYKDLVDARDIDAIAIATPVVSHYELAKRALENGKHVLVEKPLCANVKEAEGLIEIAQSHGKIVMVDHTFLYTGSVRKAKELISKGGIGELYYFDSVRINLGLFRSDVNVIWDLAPHDLSIMNYLINKKPAAISAVGTQHFGNGVEDVAYLSVQFEDNGFIAHFHCNWLSPVKIRQTLISGNKKMLVWDDLSSDEKIKVYDRGVDFKNTDGIHKLLVSYRSGDVYVPKISNSEALKLEAEYFIDCLENNREPFNNGEAGLKVVKLLEAADLSLKSDGQRIKL
jgi:predicted dehydrogenase